MINKEPKIRKEKPEIRNKNHNNIQWTHKKPEIINENRNRAQSIRSDFRKEISEERFSDFWDRL